MDVDNYQTKLPEIAYCKAVHQITLETTGFSKRLVGSLEGFSG